MTEPYVYKTIVRFSDTDVYGVVHHSNYFRWIEEARMQLMEDILHLTLHDLQEDEIQFPVIRLEGKYLKAITARQEVTVKLYLFYNCTTKLVFEYEILNECGETAFLGKTEHALTKGNKILFVMPEIYHNMFLNVMKENEGKYIVTS